MNRYSYALLAFFLISLPVVGQEKLTLSERPSSQAIESAKSLIRSAESAPTKLLIGGYAIIDIKLAGELTEYIVPGSDDCLQKIKIAKGAAYEGWLVNSATKQFKWTRIEPEKDFDRVLVTGTLKGSATIIWMGVKDGKAQVVAAFLFSVDGGTPKPDEPDIPPEPIDDITTKALRAELAKDRVKGLADNRYLSALGGIYEAASRDPLTAVKTAGDLDALLNSARLAAGIPDADKMLPAVREWLRADMVSKIASQPATVLTVDQKNVARALFVKYANALEVLSK